jgi:cell wall-associated NlpC family hydrolase
MRLLVLVCVLALAGMSVDARALPEAQERAVVDEARKILGVPYVLGGRMRDATDGIDCQGLVFFALQSLHASSTQQCGWKSYSVMPTKSIAARELGAPVDGLAPVSTEKLDVTKLRRGDVIHFVGVDVNPAEGSIAQLDGKPVWVWHMALASGDGRFIVGDHFAGAVVEEELLAYLRAHADVYQGVFVTRMKDGPRPAKCRVHAPMLVRDDVKQAE